MAPGNWVGAAAIDHRHQPGLLRAENHFQHAMSFHCQLSIPVNREALYQRAPLRTAGSEGQLGGPARRDRRKRVLIGISGIFQVAQERIVSPQPDHFSTPALPAGAALVLGRALDPDTLNPVQEFLPMTLKCFELFCGLHRLQGRRSPGQHNARVTCRNHRKNQTEPMAFRCNSGLSE